MPIHLEQKRRSHGGQSICYDLGARQSVPGNVAELGQPKLATVQPCGMLRAPTTFKVAASRIGQRLNKDREFHLQNHDTGISVCTRLLSRLYWTIPAALLSRLICCVGVISSHILHRWHHYRQVHCCDGSTNVGTGERDFDASMAAIALYLPHTQL
jgi:hypothetical protein